MKEEERVETPLAEEEAASKEQISTWIKLAILSVFFVFKITDESFYVHTSVMFYPAASNNIYPPFNGTRYTIVHCFNNLSIPQAIVSIYSVMQSNKDCVFDFWIIRPKSEEVNNVYAFRKMINWPHQLHLGYYTEDQVDRFNYKSEHYSNIIFAKLWFAQILPPTIDRILALDPDTMVVGSLKELFTMDMSKIKIACVHQIWDIGAGTPWLNSGVVVYNLELIRPVHKRLIDCAMRLPGPGDDVWHMYCFRGKRKLLSYRYNISPRGMSKPYNTTRHMKKQKIEEASPVIYHMMGGKYNVIKAPHTRQGVIDNMNDPTKDHPVSDEEKAVYMKWVDLERESKAIAGISNLID